MFSGKSRFGGASRRYGGKKWTGLSKPWEGHGIQANPAMWTTDNIFVGVWRHYRFTTCVDQHPHWSPVGRTAHHQTCTYHRTIFNIFSFFSKFEHFLCHWTLDTPTKGYQHSFKTLEVKEHKKNTKRRWVIVFFKKIGKITLYLSLVPAPHLPHF